MTTQQSQPFSFTRQDLKDLGRLTTVYIRKHKTLEGSDVFNIHFADGKALNTQLSFEEVVEIISEQNLVTASLH